MVRTLKIKITLTLSVLLSFVLIAVLVAVNVLYSNTQYKEAQRIIEEFAAFDGQRRTNNDEIRSSDLFRTAQFYSVLLDRRNNVMGTVNESSIEISVTDIYENAQKALSTGQENGVLGDYIFTVRNTWYGKIAVFMDMSVTEASIRSLGINSILFGIPGILLISLVSFLLSLIITAPVKKTLALQKEFISDAGHELKTPLSVIKANADILENIHGESKWLDYIDAECDRMNLLISRLLRLSSVEEAPKTHFCELDLSELFESVLLPLECVAFEKGKNFSIDCESGIFIKGSAEELSQLVSIFADNAIKYCSEGGSIDCRLVRKNAHVVMSISNTGAPIPEEERERIFDRFYRTDRARTGYDGYGLGLSIAKTIAERHRGRIGVDCKDGITEFSVRF